MAFSPDPFFIGWAKKPPQALHRFLLAAAGIFAIGLIAGGALMGATQADPDGGRFRFDLREQTVTGTVIAKPYPMIWLDDGQEGPFLSRTIMLNGNGKTGVQERAVQVEGARVSAKGIVMERGDLQMLQLNRGFEPIEGATPEEPERQELGTWRLTGEICDGRCLVGAMRPGTGVAHKACANLCIDGGQPPVFVSHKPIEGVTFMLMGTGNYEPLPPELLDYTGVAVQLNAKLERIGDLTLMLVDPSSLKAM